MTGTKVMVRVRAAKQIIRSMGCPIATTGGRVEKN